MQFAEERFWSTEAIEEGQGHKTERVILVKYHLNLSRTEIDGCNGRNLDSVEGIEKAKKTQEMSGTSRKGNGG